MSQTVNGRDKDTKALNKEVNVPDKEANVSDKEAKVPGKEVNVPDKEVKMPDKEADVSDKEAKVPGKEADVPNKEAKASDKEVKALKPPIQKNYRPGQRQQERIQRLARRRKRQRIVAGSIVAVLLIVGGSTFAIWYQSYSTQQTAIANAHATTVANASAHATATVVSVSAHATATVVTQNCFITPNAPAVPSVYDSSANPSAGPTTAPAISGTPVTLKDGLKYVDIKTGTGNAAKKGSLVTVNYTGWLNSTCQKFDSSYDSHSGTPPATFPVTLGQGQVISGWDEGLVGMKAGGIRRLYLPSSLGYGAQAQGPIPANSILIFDVQIVSVK